MRLESLRSLYVERLRDMRDAEHQIIKALPKMIDRAQHAELRTALSNHLEETRQQAARLEQIFEELDERAKGKKCKGMAGVLAEADELATEKGDPVVLDAAIIDAAQHVEHYEIAGYGTLCAFAGLLGYDRHELLLETSLNEEKKADETLTEIAERSINIDALRGEEREVIRGIEQEDYPYAVGDRPPEKRPFFGGEERRF
ncbi:MAG: ferritin-like domain-containing protein [Gemmatimonadota bacterium]